ncbi:hypothetical protein GK047_18835 [Paenibacillus sp. SYP-B3998]|uniref:Uncharacterized protein n=1 Tax=Paenibacillus sp. SYP-B3998 TaxID=2678564 RepID=A0A6G4A143_9BACL|nr:hypothetical protein [Paenibacillus sp. SYP-B3998]NEW08060.1 hypothetical protein [Paenibacillus sp. SYP-B3998]
MSRGLAIFCSELLTKQEVLDFVSESCNGFLKWPENPIIWQGVLESEEGTVRVHYSSDLQMWSEETAFLRETYNFITSTILSVEPISGEQSEDMATDFCIAFISRYPHSIMHHRYK